MNTDEPAKIPNLDPRSDVAGVQHPRPDIEQLLQELIQLENFAIMTCVLKQSFPPFVPICHRWMDRGQSSQTKGVPQTKIAQLQRKMAQRSKLFLLFLQQAYQTETVYVAHARRARTTGQLTT